MSSNRKRANRMKAASEVEKLKSDLAYMRLQHDAWRLAAHKLAMEVDTLRQVGPLDMKLKHHGNWKHANGGMYGLLGEGKVQSDVPLNDMDSVAVYVGSDGALWARRSEEFLERFVKQEPTAEPQPISNFPDIQEAVAEGVKDGSLSAS